MTAYVVTVFNAREEMPFHVEDITHRSEFAVTYAGLSSTDPHDMRRPAGYYFVRDEGSARKLAEVIATSNPGLLVFYGKNIGTVKAAVPEQPQLAYAKFTAEGYIPE